jgi:S1-C subfamily serine protease
MKLKLKLKKNLKALRARLEDLKTKAISALCQVLKVAANVAKALVIIIGIVYLAARAPEMHGQWLRSYVGSRVYTIRDNPKSGGGTGFAIKAPSGATYILTNDHVCGVSKDGQTVLVQNDEGLSMKRRILARADFTDLCLIEGIPGVEGLSLGSEPMIGQIVAAIGHPALMPITLSRGEIITATDIMILEGPISFIDQDGKEQQVPANRGGITPEQCSLPKNRIMNDILDFGFFQIKVKLCVIVTKGAYRTNMLIQPGNSGSPVVNFWGNVVGVVFAGDRQMWGIDVSQPDVKEFLKNY